MLTDSSLTNILVVSGVSQIRYRIYQQPCSRENLLNYLKKTPNYDTEPDILLRAFDELMGLGIPATWRVLPYAQSPRNDHQKGDTDTLLELWVFWFDERHTGKIDSNMKLKTLEEVKVGSFTWETAYSKIQSPNSSPVSTMQSNSSTPVTVSEDYKQFMKSIRNLVHKRMISKGALPLGEFYLLPHSEQDIINDDLSHNLSNLNTTLGCSYTIYLANTNLIFQPNTRRIRIRPITLQTIRSKGKKVIVSPSGDSYTMASNKFTLQPTVENNILTSWASLFDMPLSAIKQKQANMPHIAAIKSSTDEIILYPTALIFISSSTKSSSSSMAGMNGIFSVNQGFTEDLGDKWNRWAWKEKILSMNKKNTLNYWDYVCPRIGTATSVLELLSNDSTLNNGILPKALSEPVTASPLMAAKSVATPQSSSAFLRNDYSLNQHNSMTPSSNCDDDQRNNRRLQSNQSLVEFAIANFALPSNDECIMDSDNQESYMDDYSNDHEIMLSKQDTSTIAQPILYENMNQQTNNTNYGGIMDPLSTLTGITMTTNHITNHTDPSAYESPQIPNLGLEPFTALDTINGDMGISSNLSNVWEHDAMDDVDNFDFKVTDADFDFFGSDHVISDKITSDLKDDISSNIFADINQLPITDPILLPVDNKSIKLENNGLDTLMEDSIMIDYSTEKTTPVPLNKAQQQQLLDNDMENATAAVHDLTVSPLGIGMSQVDNTFNRKQKLINEEQKPINIQYQPPTDLFIPPKFAPVDLNIRVNDSKYFVGGKFEYAPEKENRVKRRRYRPNYNPLRIKKRLEEKAALKEAEASTAVEVAVEEANTKKTPPVEDRKEDEDMKTDSSETDSSASDSSDSCSESGSSSEYSDDDDSEFNDPKYVHQAYSSISGAQQQFLERLYALTTTVTKRNKVDMDDILFDYDSPFASSIISNGMRKVEGMDGKDEYKALEQLCQNAVMGGYPFAGNIESMSSNGFEANEGVSAKVLVARRRNLLQQFNGDTIHTPSIPHDVDCTIQEFKKLLGDIFSQQKAYSNHDGLCLDQPLLPSSVTVKGPLNIQQYYDLSETNQAHSKYGKYQIKKRRPAEPNLDILHPPNIVVARQDDFIEGTPKLIMFWEKLRLEPYSSKKHINYFVLYPKNESIESQVVQFFKGLSTLYETCQLGVHHPGNVGTYRKGLVPVPLLPEKQGQSAEHRQIRSFYRECQQLGSTLGAAMAENVHIVIYLVNPLSDLASHLELSRCFNELTVTYQLASAGSRVSEKTRARLVMQLIPIEHILSPTAFGGCLKFGLKEIAFSIYSKCHAVVGRHHNKILVEKKDNYSDAVTEMYAPAFILKKPIPDSIPFTVKQAVSFFPTILENHAVLHLGYCFSLNNQWLILVWTDNGGELIEYGVIDCKKNRMSLRTAFKEAWRRTQKVAQKTGFKWTYVIAKLGLMFETELKTWIRCIPDNESVAIVSLDIESPLHVTSNLDIHTDDHILSNNTTMNSNNLNTGNNLTPNDAASSVTPSYGTGQTKALLLNHRAAYSNKRERMSYGKLSMDPVSEEEIWMIPLASGYMIHTPPTTENPNKELFFYNPLVIEIHLVYNQTNHSAYSTLRDIIKKYHSLSYVNIMPSNSNCLPIHLVLVERLSRILLVVRPSPM
ncbi:mediator complex subunit 13 C-terminal-domain-containing protein [Pilobolus umbonatus]|nr:mediator complex subunit 13 C-terminal-domain-containing protein [Pilobolus umbonatus]